MADIIGYILGKYNYWMAVVLMMIGLYAMLAKKNLIKKIVGMNIFQTAIILFYISIGFKKGATVPIIEHNTHVIDVAKYANPLPHVLMLTAIVVAVSTFGVALALAVRVYQEHGTLEENEILSELQE